MGQASLFPRSSFYYLFFKTLLLKSIFRSKNTFKGYLEKKNVFGKILNNDFETLKKHLERFFEKHLGDVFFKKKTLQFFLIFL